ncbi:mitochondrial assembly of ribosomal large subunit protein 1 [Rhinoderma darwinii]|uniref:mitochondrial assembly of ribosomal large subunit protein 1 n=1 Tax=Rhinoderma darwinii TaxID=43563 RepID=UPI003F67070D
MWARRVSRLCVRHAVPGKWLGAEAKIPGLCSYRHHAGVFARSYWMTYLGAPQLPGERTCLLKSNSSYSAHMPDVKNTHTGPGRWEDGSDRRPDEALPEFNINVLVNLLRQENGRDLCVIRVPPEFKYVEYFVVVGGTSTRHLQAMAQYTLKVYKLLKGEGEPHVCLEGKDTGDWMCIDFGNIVVHFMLPETREILELEKLWTLRSYDDQLSQIADEVLPSDFTFGLQEHKE